MEKPDHGFRVGTAWLEHHGDVCGSGPVRWVGRTVEAPHHFTVEGRQSGARQRATTTVLAGPIGTSVTNLLEISTSLRASATIAERLMLPVLLGTGLGMSILADSFVESVTDDQRYLEAVAAGLGGR